MASEAKNRFSPEVRTRAVRLVFDHEKDHPSRWATVTSIAAKIGCTAQSLNEWVKKAEIDSGVRGGVPTEIAERLKALERENRELRQANEILRKASAYFRSGGARPPVQAMIAFIDDHRQAYGVEPICRVLPIAPSTYHAHLARRADPSRLPDRVRRRRGSEGRDPARVRGELPRLWRAQCLAAVAAGGRHRSAMHGGPGDAEYGPSGSDPGQTFATTISDKAALCPLDHVNRQFHASAPDRLWLADFTYVATWAGFVYVAFVIDAYARRIVGWRASRTAHADFVLDALDRRL